jgi:integrase
MVRKKLTDRGVSALKPAASGRRYEIMDALVPALGVRVTDRGNRSFFVAGRFPNSPHYTRRELGKVGALSLHDARSKARKWLELIDQGKDPAIEEKRIEQENLRRQKATFAAVAEEYLGCVVIGHDPARPKLRKAAEVAREIRCVFIPIWGTLPITEITRENVQAVIKSVKDYGTAAMLASYGVKAGKKEGKGKTGQWAERQGAPVQARNLLGYLKTMFSWAVECGTYGLNASPCDHIRARRIIGERVSIDRVLSDLELAALWRVTGRIGYPDGPAYRLLMLTGLRLNEVARATWSEFDLANGEWTIPASRMKGTNSKARAHVVPLTPNVMTIIEDLPKFKRGDFMFSSRLGERPIHLGSKAKTRLDRRMLRSLRALARMRGDDPEKVIIAPWTNHDIRRSVRTGLSRLRVDRDVAEAILAHIKRGVEGVYDRYDLVGEKRHALELWAAKLRSIVEPPTPNVIPMQRAAIL